MMGHRFERVGVDMSYVGPLPPLKVKKETRWYRFVGDSFLVLGSMLLLAEIISVFHLNQRIPDSFLIYLLLILAFASIRGLYAALLASFAAFFFYDLLFVPPAYSLFVSKFEDILALVVFLVTAIMTAQLASDLRRRAEEANRRERETHILYDLVRVTNREEGLLHQLHVFTRAVVDVFSPWGIRDCTLLLPDAMGNLVPQNAMRDPGDTVMLSPAEEQMAARVMKQAQTMDFHDGLQRNTVSANAAGVGTQKSMGITIRLVPLKTAHKVIGVLRLLIDDVCWPSSENMLGIEHDTHEALFFSTFLEQAVTVIERARLLRESVQMKVLQQTDALRAALLSSVSHDLRTPLATIKTAATSMLQMVLDEDAHNFASAIERESDRLNRLVENLLDMSRIEGGALHPKTVWYPLDELVHDVLGRMEVLLQGRAVNVHLPEELPPVELDYVQIGQVMTNLLENAVRYTPDGSPVDVSIEAQAEQVLVSIADRGPGISSSERERIFDKFYRVHREPAAADQFRGSGLGLAVCRGLVEAHGGRIWVEAREGGGGVFRFTLPRREIEENSNE
jgi:two-component system sensor histidine kinase KdpD